MANNATYPLGPIAPGVRLNGVTVTLGQSYNPPLTKIYIGGGGNVVLTMAESGTVTLSVISGGVFVDDVAILNVGTATTATNIIGFF